MSVSVYVYVTLTWHCWLSFSALPTPVSLSRSLNALFFFFFNSALWYLGFIILLSTHPGLRSAFFFFTLQSLWRSGNVYFILEERPVFLRYSDFGAVISI